MNTQTKSLIKHYVGEDVWESVKTRAIALKKETDLADKRFSATCWEWGDLLLEVVPVGRGMSKYQMDRLLEAFMDECECQLSCSTLKCYRSVCKSWPKNKRRKAGFTAHKLLMGCPERFELLIDGMSEREARKIALQNRGNERLSLLRCAKAIKSYTDTLIMRLPEDPGEDVVTAISDAWMELSRAIDELGFLDELIREYDEASRPDLTVVA